ncbi:MAG: hypothetical protein ACRCVN_05870 [Spirochaetia bacterium]
MKYFGLDFKRHFESAEKDLVKFIDADDDPFWVVEKVLEQHAICLPNFLVQTAANVLIREREKLELAKTQIEMF